MERDWGLFVSFSFLIFYTNLSFMKLRVLGGGVSMCVCVCVGGGGEIMVNWSTLLTPILLLFVWMVFIPSQPFVSQVKSSCQ